MINFIDIVRQNPEFYKQLSVDDQLVTEYNCPIDVPKDILWTTQGYFVYVIDGKKVWHIPGQTFELTAGKCLFVKKGAHIVEQFFDSHFCVVVFFVSEEFVANTLRENSINHRTLTKPTTTPVISFIDADNALHAFFNSVVPYFLSNNDVNKSLLELKFKELILNVVNNPKNDDTTCYFCSLLTDSAAEQMRKIMEENFLYNLAIDEFAKLCGKSLSSFKRDFEEIFGTTPGRWLLERRLQHAEILLTTSSKSVSEVAFESGFENISHFSKSFKGRFGHSPAQHRQEVR